MGQLKIENDMVNTFFDEVHKLSDPFVFSFIESLKQDIELIIQTLLMTSTELATLSTEDIFKRLFKQSLREY
jgi:hypothetical protein